MFGKMKMPELPKGEPAELMGRGLAAFLRGVGVDPAVLLPMAQEMLTELKRVGDRLDGIERHVKGQWDAIGTLETKTGQIMSDIVTIAEILRATVPEAAVALLHQEAAEAEAHTGAAVQRLIINGEIVEPKPAAPAPGAMTADNMRKVVDNGAS